MSDLTSARIRRILELHDELLRRTRKDVQALLAAGRLPDIGRHETLTDVVATDMAKYLAGWGWPGRSSNRPRPTRSDGHSSWKP
jgi:hypothetical protein